MAKHQPSRLSKVVRALRTSPVLRVLMRRRSSSSAASEDSPLEVAGLERVAASRSSVTVIFVHYHHRGLVTPGFRRLILSAVHAGYRCLFVSTKLSPQAADDLAHLDLAVIKRGNLGYDFGSIKEARDLLMGHGLLGSSRYVFLNSSMLNIASDGFGHDDFLDALANPDCPHDLLGVTSSFENAVFHVQSYFFSVSARLFESKAFGRFLGDYIRGIRVSKDSPRLYAIKNGELKLTRFAITQGLSVGSLLFNGGLPELNDYALMKDLGGRLSAFLAPLESTAPRSKVQSLLDDFCSEWLPSAGLQFNPSQSCWALLLARGFLFLKREALELSDTRSIHAPSVCAMIVPLLDQLGIILPPWSDLHHLPEILFAPKAKTTKD